MNYIDFATAVAIFLFFIAMVLTLTTNYFSNLSSLKTSELSSLAESLFKIILNQKGIPEDWNQDPTFKPVQIGLAEDLYLAHFLVTENAGSNRTEEPSTAHVVFDENCENKSWNNTIRMYDEDNKELNIELSNTTFCANQFLNQSDITWEVNIFANQTKKYYLYYSPDNEITNLNYTYLSYNTSSWVPSDRDSWTETTTNWSRYQGSSGSVTNDTINRIRGNSSVNITGTFNYGGDLGLQYLSYSSSDDIKGISNDWYIDVWIYVDNKNYLDHLYIETWPSSSSYSVKEDIYNNITDSTWYHFVKILDYHEWNGGVGFPDFSNGIDFIRFYITNTTPNLNRTLKVDVLHLKKPPLEIKTFPEEKITTISETKFDALKNLSYDEVRNTICENCEFSIDIDEDAYGVDVNQSMNVGCYESPQIVEYINGTIKTVMARTCVGK
jgi:hypothetical protein